MPAIKDLTGEKIGRLTVIERVENKGVYVFWKCRCDCGNVVEVSANSLQSKRAKSCGCLSKEMAAHRLTTHGMRKTRLYNIWAGMNRRCKTHRLYAGRGIKVCPLWKNSFLAFYRWSIDNGYKESLTIDRIDCRGDYTPSNCRWATCAQQNNNKRDNVWIEINGKNKSLADWAWLFNINRGTVYSRIYDLNWSAEKALTTPVDALRKKRCSK